MGAIGGRLLYPLVAHALCAAYGNQPRGNVLGRRDSWLMWSTLASVGDSRFNRFAIFRAGFVYAAAGHAFARSLLRARYFHAALRASFSARAFSARFCRGARPTHLRCSCGFALPVNQGVVLGAIFTLIVALRSERQLAARAHIVLAVGPATGRCTTSFGAASKSKKSRESAGIACDEASYRSLRASQHRLHRKATLDCKPRPRAAKAACSATEFAATCVGGRVGRSKLRFDKSPKRPA